MIYFLKIDGIPGESIDDQHRDEIEALSVSWGVSQSGTVSSGVGGGAGKASFRDLQFVMGLNRASPQLMLACAKGQHIKEAILTVRKSGADQEDFCEIKLTDLIISSFAETGEVELLQQVSLDYAKIEYSYKRQKADGSLEDASPVGWDVSKNAEL